jgi:hypothetical protein
MVCKEKKRYLYYSDHVGEMEMWRVCDHKTDSEKKNHIPSTHQPHGERAAVIFEYAFSKLSAKVRFAFDSIIKLTRRNLFFSNWKIMQIFSIICFVSLLLCGVWLC